MEKIVDKKMSINNLFVIFQFRRYIVIFYHLRLQCIYIPIHSSIKN